MKRYLAAIAITVLLCSLAACGEATTPASGGSAAPAQSSQAASETNAPDEPVSSPSPLKAVVSVDYAPDELAAAYTDGNSDYQVKVVFTANTDIREFKYLELGLSDQEQSNDISLKAEKILFEMGTLTPGKPLVVSMLFDGALPNRGIAYLDETGTERFFTVTMSGKDESLLLTEFTPAS